MAKPRATAQNAVTHGIFRQDRPTAPSSPFAVLAMQSFPGRLGEDMADDLMRAERQTARCRATLLEETRALETLLAAALLQTDTALDTTIQAALSQLTRLLRYQNQSLTTLRKARIAILNTAEGFGALTDQGRG
ncbi:hypothetical protein [Fuscovulum ytuae]|uniref:Uncharacterized protein n=1 Tax=Fuscovulum ytuae TaxID=3042299 RepID=A0ABY8Q4Y0_9RHOB|nr:hypothetical protein [Fuscovulum sp. YMD61]WGV15914.1 hypothetical protein QF092_16930 [Fuscovulum sp. YMD61]